MVIQKNWQTLIKPKQLSVESGDDPKRVATVVAEPLERGFGLTRLEIRRQRERRPVDVRGVVA